MYEMNTMIEGPGGTLFKRAAYLRVPHKTPTFKEQLIYNDQARRIRGGYKPLTHPHIFEERMNFKDYRFFVNK